MRPTRESIWVLFAVSALCTLLPAAIALGIVYLLSIILPEPSTADVKTRWTTLTGAGGFSYLILRFVFAKFETFFARLLHSRPPPDPTE